MATIGATSLSRTGVWDAFRVSRLVAANKWNDNYGQVTSSALGTYENPASSAGQIYRENNSATNGAYWILPPGQTVPFQVHCIFTEAGGWMQALKVSPGITVQGINDAFCINWGGWAFSTRAQCGGVGGGVSAWARINDEDSMTPVYLESPFQRVMLVTLADQSYRLAWHHDTVCSSMRAMIMQTQTGNNHAKSWLFPNVNDNDKSLLRRLRVHAGVDTQPCQTTVRFGFKVRSDSQPYTAASSVQGGFPSGGGHYWAQIGIGGEGTTNGHFGGGIGGSYVSDRGWRCHGHWWGHGDLSHAHSGNGYCMNGAIGVYVQ